MSVTTDVRVLSTTEHRMTDQAWKARLPEAETPTAVLGLARQFLSTWAAPELAALPLECRPPIMHEPENVGAYALTLVRHQCLHEPDENTARMADFFTAAQQHLSQLLSEAGQRSVLSNPRYLRPAIRHHPK